MQSTVDESTGSNAPLYVLDHSGDESRRHIFGVDDNIKCALVSRDVGVVVMRHDVEGSLAEWQLLAASVFE